MIRRMQNKASTTSKLSFETRFKPWVGLILIAPWLVGLLLFKLVPILASLTLSFTDFHLLNPELVQFTGTENYTVLFRDVQGWQSLLDTLKLALIIIPVQVFGSILVAALLGSRRLWQKNLVRTLFFIPSIIPAFSAALMWQGYIDPATGWLNRLFLNPLGLEALNIFASRDASQPLFILSSLWTIGPGILIMLGAMQGIPVEIFEAALIDGADRFTRFFKITLPLITPAIFFALVLNLTSVFGGAILLDRGSRFRNGVSTYDGYINLVLLDMFKLGYASSLAWVFFVIIMSVVLILFATSKYWVYFPERDK